MLCTSALVDDVIFSNNERKRPESKYRSSSSADGGTGAKSAVSDCVMLLLLL